MARNDARRAQIADAGLQVIASEGARGLTHRAVDLLAGVPVGTTSNYFPTRDALLAGLVDRIYARIAPEPEKLETLAAGEPTVERATDYVLYIVERLNRSRDLALALFEVRLEAARRPDLAERLGAMLRGAFRFDVEFNASRGLPGGAFEIALLHYAIDGLMFDRLTVAIDPETSSEDVARAFVRQIVGGG